MIRTKAIAASVILTVLAGCGADGEPVQPSATAGVSVSTSGVHVGGGVGLHKGPLSIMLGF